jgi:hypothetical protein
MYEQKRLPNSIPSVRAVVAARHIQLMPHTKCLDEGTPLALENVILCPRLFLVEPRKKQLHLPARVAVFQLLLRHDTRVRQEIIQLCATPYNLGLAVYSGGQLEHIFREVIPTLPLSAVGHGPQRLKRVLLVMRNAVAHSA